MVSPRYGLRVATIVLSVALLASFAPHPASAVTGRTSTSLGRIYAGDGKTALEAYLDNPSGFTLDAKGNFFIADTYNNVIRRIDPANVVSTYAGTGQLGSGNGKQRRSAQFNQPEAVAVAANGSLYIADTGNGRIREISRNVVTTWPIALRSPRGLLPDNGNLFVAETAADRILRINLTTKAVSIVARISKPWKLTKLGNILYVVSHGQTRVTEINLTTGAQRNVTKGLVDASGITTYSGRYVYFTAGSNGIYNEIYRFDTTTRKVKRLVRRLETEWLNYASDLLFRGSTLYVLHSRGSSIFTMDTNALNPVHIAGKHRYGQEFGVPAALLLGKPKALAASKDGQLLYISQNHQFAVYDRTAGQLRFLAGHANDNFVDTADGRTRMSQPIGIVLSKDEQTLYFVDRNNNRIRQLDVTTGVVSTLTGSGAINSDAKTVNGYANGGPCPAEFRKGVKGCAYFDQPSGIVISNDGKTLFVADTDNHRIRSVDIATGQVRFVAGSGQAGFVDAVGNRARFSSPFGLALSKGGRFIYVVDKGNHAVRQLDLKTKRVTTLVGKGRPGYREGAFRLAFLSFPEYIAVGPDGNLYVSDVGSQRIRVLDLRRKTTRLLAGSGAKGSKNGAGRFATFFNPKGLTFIGNDLYVADSTNDLIRMIETK